MVEHYVRNRNHDHLIHAAIDDALVDAVEYLASFLMFVRSYEFYLCNDISAASRKIDANERSPVLSRSERIDSFCRMVPLQGGKQSTHACSSSAGRVLSSKRS